MCVMSKCWHIGQHMLHMLSLHKWRYGCSERSVYMLKDK